MTSGAETRVLRGEEIESLHQACVVAAPRGGGLSIWGGPDPGSHLRSVAKPFQTLTLFAAGVVEAFRLRDEELAVITASHAGEPYHHELVAALLDRGRCAPDDLRCGVHPPFSRSERQRRVAAGEPFSPLGNNCSGKHAGMLLHARHIGADPSGYLDPQHPVQEAVHRLLETFIGSPLPAPAVDGCGAPTVRLPLAALAGAFRRLHDPAAPLAAARERLHRVLGEHPRAFSGEDRLPSRFAPFLAPAELRCKEGAEGLFVIWGPPGAVILKARDGSERGYRFLVPAVLRRLGWIEDEGQAAWHAADPPVVHNVAGRVVGRLEAVLGEPEAPAVDGSG